jgi:membrane protease YdiL (CAAX protease family)
MNLRLLLNPLIALAALLTLVPFFAAAFCSSSLQLPRRLPLLPRILTSALLGVPYTLVSIATGVFRWHWLALYTLLPVAITLLLYQASVADPQQRGDWRDFLILLLLGLAVDLRWFEGAWGPRLAVFNKMLLLDAGIYSFHVIRQLRGSGFDLRLRLGDLGAGMAAFAAYAPIAVVLGLMLGFLHFHPVIPSVIHALAAWVFTFFFIAVPEELFFRGWLQNLLEQRVRPARGLLITSTLFGLSHFNKRAAAFNWRYVLLATLAGIFYGLAWRQQRRVGASAITHASVDTIWSLWLR